MGQGAAAADIDDRELVGVMAAPRMFTGDHWALRCMTLAAAGILFHCGDNPAGQCASTANVQVRRCPNLSSLAIVPNHAAVGGSVAVTASVTSAADGGVPVLAWSASGGTFADPSAPLTTFTCTAPGPAAVTIAATQDGCTETLTGSVDCAAGRDAGMVSAAGGVDGAVEAGAE